MTGAISILTTNLTPFGFLATGSSLPFTATFGTAPVGSYSATYTLNLSDDVHLVGAAPQSLTLTISGTIAYLRGDFNIDGQLTAADIPAMLAALTNLPAYRAEHNLSPDDLLAIGDVDSSGAINNADIQTELDRIAGVGALTAVPEPATIVMLSASSVLILFALQRRHRR